MQSKLKPKAGQPAAAMAKSLTAAGRPDRSLEPKAVHAPLRINEGLCKPIEEGKL